MAELTTNVRYIKGIGEQRAKVLSRLGINTLRDLVSYFPRDYEDRRVIRTISAASVGETACIRAMVATAPRLSRVRKGLELVKFRIVDETGAIDVTYFNQKYVKDQLRLGETYIFYGKVGGFPSRKTLSNPIFEREDASGNVTGRIVPIYRLTAGISQKILMNAVFQGLAACGDSFPDYLPYDVREKFELAQARFSYENIHFPRDFGALELARRRLIFEELFVLSCALGLLKGRRSGKNGIRFSETDMEEFYFALPFTPMGAQRRAVADAVRDMCSGRPMNRLVQGDVGSGKTLVAAACIWFAWKNGCQSAFMAPTEILADQHFKTLCGFLEPFGLRVGKLTGSMTAKNKRETRDALALGMLDLVVGTHALLSENIEFNRLGLVITDEQHRFGVEQRSTLSAKGENPHVLVMSATPIPRTLALIIYGDLDVSIIDEMPPGRQKVDTYVVGEEIRPRINNFIRRLVSEGRQVFIVCPMIEENEELPQDLKPAREWAEHLQKRVFPDLKIACIHGKMKSREKDELMAAFVAGEYQILVSTTVIEVGIDVPNAALMIVENAERFGLSQLHQLRGRVGRGRHKSYCILFSSSTDDEARARLNVMCKTSDGFKIAEEDLRLRGPGDFFGSRQHGLPEMRIADLCTDIGILQTAQDAAHQLLREDPELQQPKNAPLLARIRELFEIRGEIFN
jgi:ATP-dependent DNA helicase RecG